MEVLSRDTSLNIVFYSNCQSVGISYFLKNFLHL